jgi:hypothetical protein
MPDSENHSIHREKPLLDEVTGEKIDWLLVASEKPKFSA